MFNKMFVIRVVLVSYFGLVILESVEAECIHSFELLGCYNTKISQEILNESYENYTILVLSKIIEPLERSSFIKMKKLTKITIKASRIGIIYSETFKDIPHLESIKMDVVKIGEIQESAFLNLPKLKYVSIGFNDIPFLRKGIFRDISQLYSISLQNSNIRAFYDVPNLKELYLHNNLLTVVTTDMLYNLNNLNYLNLANNRISIIEKNSFGQTPHLLFLNLESNQLKALDLDIFPTTGMKYLLSIRLNGNGLMYLPFTFFNRTINLEEISLSHNPWFCPCLKEIYEILNLHNIKEYWARESVIYHIQRNNKKTTVMHSSRLPICISNNASDIICINTYSDKLSEKYIKYIEDYENFF
ncbi:unnamed protein product [Psylliodes chrysocephalus]|uniref:Uncharacterized protein n=1 Tax=Psylliodes chrysocephalus TaxID=3402493 RepID=A0A9P0CNC6_9CUCU|nr:unnamed protein product [Psylliodes chrysocephala]